MAKEYKNFQKGIGLVAKNTSDNSTLGDLEVLISTGKIQFHNGTNSSPIVTESHSATLTAKNISFTDNTITATALELKTAVTGTTGSNNLVFSDSPTLVTPSLGNATASSINKLTITTPATGSTLTISDGKTLNVNNSLTLTGTDSSSINLGTGGTVAYLSDKLSAFSTTSSSELAGVISDETGSGLLVFNNSPSLTNPQANAIKLVNTGIVTLSASLSSSTYDITLPTNAPNVGTGLYYDGSNYVWQSIATAKKTKYDYVVGSAAEVSAGSADYTSLQSAINALSSGGSILISSNYSTSESITVLYDNILIEGQGNKSVINGTLTFSATTNNCSIKDVRITGNITFNSGSSYNMLTNFWFPASATITNSGTANYILGVQE